MPWPQRWMRHSLGAEMYFYFFSLLFRDLFFLLGFYGLFAQEFAVCWEGAACLPAWNKGSLITAAVLRQKTHKNLTENIIPQHFPWRSKPQQSLLLTTHHKAKGYLGILLLGLSMGRTWSKSRGGTKKIREMEPVPGWWDGFENLKRNKNQVYRLNSRRKMEEQTQSL